MGTGSDGLPRGGRGDIYSGRLQNVSSMVTVNAPGCAFARCSASGGVLASRSRRGMGGGK